jgi:hypothetical protein
MEARNKTPMTDPSGKWYSTNYELGVKSDTGYCHAITSFTNITGTSFNTRSNVLSRKSMNWIQPR